jgi:Na+/H+ antiporter NhaD/arsenite permease-like protein
VLTNTGFTGRFALWMVEAAGSSAFTQAVVYGYVSALLVNCFNDLPRCVCFMRALADPLEHVPSEGHCTSPIICSSRVGQHCILGKYDAGLV